MDKKGLFIAFEGIDGSGKSTQVKKLTAHLRQQGHKVHATFEPTDSPIGKMIRSIFNHQMEGDQKVIAALFVADRLNHLLNTTDGMLKKYEAGYIVITDRYYLSSYVYHSIHGIDLEWIIQANSMSADLLKPDLNIFIDIEPEVSMQRLLSSRENIEMYENLTNLKNVQKRYYEVIKKVENHENIQIVNGNQDIEAIFSDTLNLIKPFIRD
ncbi:MAG: dTMP kinase [Chitinophagales bacterium]|nr:dTMP kinase [Chitinophagales bacterium]